MSADDPTFALCLMIVGWTTDSEGEPDKEIMCGKPAIYYFLDSGVPECCQECHDRMDIDIADYWRRS